MGWRCQSRDESIQLRPGARQERTRSAGFVRLGQLLKRVYSAGKKGYPIPEMLPETAIARQPGASQKARLSPTMLWRRFRFRHPGLPRAGSSSPGESARRR